MNDLESSSEDYYRQVNKSSMKWNKSTKAADKRKAMRKKTKGTKIVYWNRNREQKVNWNAFPLNTSNTSRLT